jgi:N-acetylmuramoyl-L-alanine amidase
MWCVITMSSASGGTTKQSVRPSGSIISQLCMAGTLAVLVTLFAAIASAAPLPEITIVYPKPDQTLGASDSSFILGHIPARFVSEKGDYVIRVNGLDFPVHPEGGFIAWVPLKPGNFTFQIAAFRRTNLPKKRDSQSGKIAEGSVNVKVPAPSRSIPDDSLAIVGDYKPPKGNLTMSAGERLDVSFQGTPNAIAWFSIPGVADSVPMIETAPHTQPFWGEAVFGAGAVPDSLMIKGVYTGYLMVPFNSSVDSAPIVYHVSFSPHRQLKTPRKPISKESGYRISINSRQYPFTVRFTDSVQIIRHVPLGGYLSIFQPKGVEAWVIGAEGDWYRIKLSASQYGWVAKASVEKLPFGSLPPKSLVRTVRTYGSFDATTIELSLAGMHPYRVFEDDRRTVHIQLFGVNSDTDWIRYDHSDSLIDLIQWSQPEPDRYELTVKLNHDLWGYDTYYRGNSFYCKFIKAPRDVHSIKGKIIVLDPGHSADPGSIGPTGYTEAEANLAMALVVKNELTSRGARVIMTRSDASNVPLYDRPAIAKKAHAEIFVSIHQNALPDGVSPFGTFGVSTYYYHPHSIDLARDVLSSAVKHTGLIDYGLYHGNLAVDRPTQYPAMLIECAFMIIPEQEALIKSDKFRKQIAESIGDGIEQYLKAYDSPR